MSIFFKFPLCSNYFFMLLLFLQCHILSFFFLFCLPDPRTCSGSVCYFGTNFWVCCTFIVLIVFLLFWLWVWDGQSFQRANFEYFILSKEKNKFNWSKLLRALLNLRKQCPHSLSFWCAIEVAQAAHCFFNSRDNLRFAIVQSQRAWSSGALSWLITEPTLPFFQPWNESNGIKPKQPYNTREADAIIFKLWDFYKMQKKKENSQRRKLEH